MMTEEIATLAQAVDNLDREKARRVARLVLECRAPLKDALEAVQLADTVNEAQRAAIPHKRWQRVRVALGWQARAW